MENEDEEIRNVLKMSLAKELIIPGKHSKISMEAVYFLESERYISKFSSQTDRTSSISIIDLFTIYECSIFFSEYEINVMSHDCFCI